MKKIAMMLLLVLASSLAWGADSVTVPFTFNDHAKMIVEIKVDGETRKMIFDTGAERSVILDSRNVQHDAFVSIGGLVVGRFPLLMVDMSKFPNVVQAIQASGRDVSGLLGEDILRHFKTIAVDNEAHTITLQK